MIVAKGLAVGKTDSDLLFHLLTLLFRIFQLTAIVDFYLIDGKSIMEKSGNISAEKFLDRHKYLTLTIAQHSTIVRLP